MRVLQVIDSLDQGGAERSLVDLLPHLGALGVETEIAVLRGGGVYSSIAVDAGVTVHVLPGGRVEQVRALHRLVGTTQPDLVHATLFEANLVARAVAVGRRVPLVVSLVGTPYGPDHRTQPGLRPYKVRAVQAIDAATARVVRRFHANAHHVAETMATRLRLPRDRIDVVPRGRDADQLGTRTESRRLAVRSALGLPATSVAIVIAARHEHAKGIDVGLRAFAELAESHRDAVLLVAGREGSATTQLRTLVEDLKLAERVHLLGHRDDIADLFVLADAVLVPSRREGFPGVVIEAMALEAPVVASDLPGVREAGGTVAALAPIGDVDELARQLATTLEDPRRALERAVAGRQRFLDRFTTPAVARQFVSFYGRALGR